MIRTVRFLPRGDNDIEQAAVWYEKKQTGLGSEFMDAVGHAIRLLEQDADRRPFYYKKFRRIILRRFPYKIFYRLREDEVIIYRVLHAKQEHAYRFGKG